MCARGDCALDFFFEQPALVGHTHTPNQALHHSIVIMLPPTPRLAKAKRVPALGS